MCFYKIISFVKYLCEIDLLEATRNMLTVDSNATQTTDNNSTNILLPKELAKFEMHLSQPLRMNNIRKRMQAAEGKVESKSFDGRGNQKNKTRPDGTIDENSKEDPIKQFALKQHLYAEGPDCLLSDVIIFVHLYMIFRMCNLSENQDHLAKLLPNTMKWYIKMGQEKSAGKIAGNLVLEVPKLSVSVTNSNFGSFSLPHVPEQSLYKSDPTRINPASRIFTKSHKINRAMSWFQDSKILRTMRASESQTMLSDEVVQRIDWSSLPSQVRPLEGGQLPPKRAEKKCQQLENLALAVLSMVKMRASSKGVKIVDFCSGGGHLAILLAHLLPECIIYLVENKPESLERAMERVEKLKLTNCHFFQGKISKNLTDC